jgi:signal transduction histidine kinase
VFLDAERIGEKLLPFISPRNSLLFKTKSLFKGYKFSMEKVLKKHPDTEMRVRSLLNEAPFSTALLSGPDLVVELANEASLQLWGKDESIIGKKLLDALPEIATQPFYGILKQVYLTGETFEGKESIAHLKVNGEMKQVYVNFVFKAMHNDSGDINGVLATGYDVTELVEARKKIADAEERARLAIESAGAGTFDRNYLTGEMITSARFDAMYGFDEPRKVDDYIALVHPEDLPVREEAVKNAFKNGDVFYEIRLIWADKTIHWIRIRGKVYFDISGKPVRMIGTGLDITDQKMSFEKLQESEQRFRTLITEAPENASALYAGRELRIQYVNAVMLKFWNKDASIIGKTFREAVPELIGQPFFDILDKVYTTGETYSGKEEKALLMRNGKLEPSYYNYTYKALRDGNGAIYGIHHMAHEVTDTVIAKQRLLENEKRFREELESKIAERTKELEHSNNELQQFAYVASHDLQEPLRKIATFTELLSKSLGDIPEKSKGYLDRISNSATRMLGLIRDVLNFSKLTVKDSQYTMVNLNDILREVMNDYELLIEEKQAIVESQELPIIAGIPSQLNQLFNNLLSNSLKFTGQGRKPRITIRAQTLRSDDVTRYQGLNRNLNYVKLEWEDNGVGFEQKYAEQVFEIFQRLHDRNRYTGSGIGLAICKRIVSNHNGDINVTSIHDKGTIFHIVLPTGEMV